MFKNGWTVVVVLLVVLACVFFWPKKGDGPIIPGKIVTVDSVIIHDTVVVEKRVDQFRVTTRVIHDTVPGAGGKDTTRVKNCYSFDEIFKSGAYVSAEMCSRTFPALRPADLTGKITYLPPPESLKIETRIDTVPRIVYRPPVIPTWQAVTLGIAAGVLAGILVKK